MANTKSLREILKEQTSGISPLVANRQKVDTDTVRTMEQLTLSSVDLATTDDGEFAIVVFAEIPEGFYFGGKVLTEIVKNIYKYYGAEENEPLDISAEGIAVACETRISKNKRAYTLWRII